MGKRLPRIRAMRLGEKLRQIRLSRELSQDGMLAPLGLSALYRSKISRYEKTGDPDLPILLKYARLAEVSTDDLIDDEANLPRRIERAAIRGEAVLKQRRAHGKNKSSRSTK
jgi:transcriptional regulator with XRE-family HTH domain